MTGLPVLRSISRAIVTPYASSPCRMSARSTSSSKWPKDSLDICSPFTTKLAPMQARLEARRLTKYYAGVAAVQGFSLTVEPGAIVGLLGPNGSGKSTTVSMLTGLREPSSGQVLFNGRAIADHLFEYKARLGYVPEEAHL